MRIRKTGAVLLTLVLTAGLAGMAGPLAQAAQPRIYHTIKSTFAGGSTSGQSGCLATTVWISSARGQYAAQPGPVGKQTITDVLIIVTDTCGQTQPQTFAAGGGATVLDAEGQTWAAPTFAPRLARAALHVTLPMYDSVSGTTFTVNVQATWTASGPLVHTTGQGNINVPLVGGVHSRANNMMRPAMISVTVHSDLVNLTGTSSDALLEVVKARCMEVVHPKYTGESDWCFGFPG